MKLSLENVPVDLQPHAFRQLGSLEFLAKQAVEGFITGLHRSPYHGFSVEFAEHRLYNPGESMRHVDWKLYARSDRLYVKRYEEETNLRCQIVIDTSGSMYYPADVTPESGMNKIKFATHAAATLIELFKRQRDAVGLSLFDAELHAHHKARSTVAHHRLLYAELEKTLSGVGEGGGETAAVEALHTVAEATPKRSLIVLFSDLLDRTQDLDAVFAALAHLRHAKHEVVVFHVLDERTEQRFDFADRPTTFIDLESGDEVRANPAELRDAYVARMADLRRELDVRCGSAGIDWVEVDIAAGVNPVLTAYLLKRQRMG